MIAKHFENGFSGVTLVNSSNWNLGNGAIHQSNIILSLIFRSSENIFKELAVLNEYTKVVLAAGSLLFCNYF